MTTNRHQNLVNWARQYMYNKSNVYQGVDNKLEDQYHREGAVIVSNLVSRCVSHEPKSRPRMAEVLEPSYVMRESSNTPERTLTLGRGNHLLSFFLFHAGPTGPHVHVSVFQSGGQTFYGTPT